MKTVLRTGFTTENILVSVTRFFLVAEGQYVHGIVLRFMPIQSHKAGIPETNNQLAHFRKIVEWSANLRGRFQQSEMSINNLTGTPARLGIFFCQKSPATFQAARGTFGNNYSWHWGDSVSSSVPQVFSQLRTSSLVR